MDMMVPLIGSAASGFGSDVPIPPELKYKNDDDGLKKASKDFVSVMFSYMFGKMRGSDSDDEAEDEDNVVSGKLFGGDNFSMFASYLDQEVGKKFTEQGGGELVNSLFNQLKASGNLDDSTKDKDKNIKKENNQISISEIKENKNLSNLTNVNKLI